MKNTVKIVYICCFSTPEVRSRLKLASLSWSNLLRRLKGLPLVKYGDSGTWNADFIKTFENQANYNCTVISHGFGMKNKEQRFEMRGVNYIFLQQKEALKKKVIKTFVKRMRQNDYEGDGRRIKRYVDAIDPDLVIVCGAENAIYSSSVLYIKDKPVFILMQTLINSTKRKEMGMGNDAWRRFEDNVLKKACYFGTLNKEEVEYIHQLNPHANCLRLAFPSSAPNIDRPKEKEYDFVFFANSLSKYKGSEDALRAFCLVHRKYPQAKFNMIGACEKGFMERLEKVIIDNQVSHNVVFHNHFPMKADMIRQVQKARFAVLPSITAALNSTVRESMFMEIPVIIYETAVTSVINKECRCLLSARMEDVDDLGQKMIYAYEHTEKMKTLAKRAKNYASKMFSIEGVKKTMDADVRAIIAHYYKKEYIPKELLFD